MVDRQEQKAEAGHKYKSIYCSLCNMASF